MAGSDQSARVQQGDKVRLVHASHITGVVSSVSEDGTLMLCLPIGGSYQLRGPFMPIDVALVEEQRP